jgi:hypothetical protein
MPPAVRPYGDWLEEWIFGTGAQRIGRNTEWGSVEGNARAGSAAAGPAKELGGPAIPRSTAGEVDRPMERSWPEDSR